MAERALLFFRRFLLHRYDFLSEQPELAAAADAHGLRRRGAPVKHATSHDAELAKKKGGGGALTCLACKLHLLAWVLRF